MDNLLMQLTRLAAAFPRDNVPESTVALYGSELRDLYQPLLAEVLREGLKSYRNFPSIAEVREDYRTTLLRIQQNSRPALSAPDDCIPMPEEIRKKWREMLRRMDDRAKQVESE